MSNEDFNYYRQRERQERTAAKSATSLPARRIHQELALRYSILIASADEVAAAA